jgi:predicted nucleic acid-binding protein
VKDLVVDASVAVKWLVPEPDSAMAIALIRQYRLIAPDLLLLECVNTFWKKVRRKELTLEEALISAQGIEQANIELVAARGQAETITRLATALDRPAYDCAYIAVALTRRCQLATADRRLLQVVSKLAKTDIRETVVLFTELVPR